jgi:hypothetical protein
LSCFLKEARLRQQPMKIAATATPSGRDSKKRKKEHKQRHLERRTNISQHSNHNGQGRQRALQTRWCMRCISGTLKEAIKALNKSGLESETGNNNN